jgi:hypothetical protein
MRPRPAGGNFPWIARQKSNAGEAYKCYILHMKTTSNLKINMLRAYLGLYIYLQYSNHQKSSPIS